MSNKAAVLALAATFVGCAPTARGTWKGTVVADRWNLNDVLQDSCDGRVPDDEAACAQKAREMTDALPGELSVRLRVSEDLGPNAFPWGTVEEIVFGDFVAGPIVCGAGGGGFEDSVDTMRGCAGEIPANEPDYDRYLWGFLLGLVGDPPNFSLTVDAAFGAFIGPPVSPEWLGTLERE